MTWFSPGRFAHPNDTFPTFAPPRQGFPTPLVRAARCTADKQHIMSWFSLNKTMGSNYTVDPGDIVNTKTALNQLGYYDVPPHRGIDDWTDDAMFNGIKTFQKDNALKVDGLMRPGGPTEAAINSSLAEGGSGTAPDNSGNVIQVAGRREPHVAIPSKIPQNQRDQNGRPITCPPLGPKDKDDPTKQWDKDGRLNRCEPGWWGTGRWVPTNQSRSRQ